MIAEHCQNGVDYWMARLRSGLDGSSFPVDYRRGGQSAQRGSVSVPLSNTSWRNLIRACEAERLTVDGALIGLLQILLYRYVLADNIQIGVHNGSMLSVCTEIEPSCTVRQNLEKAEVSVQAAKTQACSWEQLQAWRPDPDVSATQTIFRLVLSIPEKANQRVEPRRIGEQIASCCDLLISFDSPAEAPVLRADFDRNKYRQETVHNILRQLGFLVESFAELLMYPVNEVPLFSAEEARLMVQAVEGEVNQYAGSQCLHRRFEEQVRKTAQGIAITMPGERQNNLTYAEINTRANRLAHYLKGLGVGQDVLVGLYLERTPDMLIAMLAILKAGGAYLPIDLSYPSDRVSFMLRDADSPVVITDSKTARDLPETGASVIRIDEDEEKWAGFSGDNLPQDVGPDNLAYCIFTSGSTGKPKGVLVTHRNVARLFEATDSWFHFSESDTWTFFHSCAFDFSVWEIWGALLCGGRLVIVPFADSRSPERFYDLLAEEKVTVLNQTPSAFRQLVGVDERRLGQKLTELRLVIFGGEALNLQSLGVWIDKYGDAQPQLVNMYGITETTVHVTYRPLKGSDLTEAPGSVIGRPIPDLSLHILDSKLRPLPVGVPGEIFVGGGGVARGYLKRAELNAEKFVRNPFSNSNATLYRSGDLARRLPSGDLEYMGRLDHQVKIRGFRIELGEVQSALTRQASVREAFVIVRDHAGDKELVAYIVPANGETPARDTLRRALQSSLPSYMVPSHFVYLPQLPLTQNGKIDRGALPAPASHRVEMEQPFQAPRTELERGIAKIYQQVLDLDRVGIDDDFFDLGGNSLNLAHVHAQLQKLIGRTFSVVELFVHTTVRKLTTSFEQTPQKLPQKEIVNRAQRQRQAISAGNWRR